MTREEKANMIESIKTNLDTNSTIYLTDCSGLDADTTSKLRRACFKSNIKMSIVKNTLLFKAMEAVDKDFGELKSVLKGNTALMFSEVGNVPAKVIKNFRKKSERNANAIYPSASRIATQFRFKHSIEKFEQNSKYQLSKLPFFAEF